MPTDDVAPFENQQPLFSRCSGRVVRQLDRYVGLGESVENLPNDIDPYTYKEAIEVSHWQKAMESKLGSMYSNQV